MHFEKAIGKNGEWKPERELIDVLFQVEDWSEKEACLFKLYGDR